MKLNIVGRNMDVTPALRETIEDKLGKLDKFFTQETEANVTLAVDKERHKIEVTIPVKGDIIRSEQVRRVRSLEGLRQVHQQRIVRCNNRCKDREQYLQKDQADTGDRQLIFR